MSVIVRIRRTIPVPSDAARGVVSRASAIITRAERDGDPLTCAGETFTSFGLIAGWLVLD